MSEYNFVLAPRIVFGNGSAKKISSELGKENLKKPLLVTDGGLVKAGVAKEVADSLKSAGLQVEVFDKVEPNPSEVTVANGVAAFKKGGCDSVLALGGGSPMDAAKAIGVMVNNKGMIMDYCGFGKLEKPSVYLACIPTTAGTGSEVSNASVITNSQEKNKMLIISNYLYPKLAILDPSLTVALPPKLTAETGVDALTHAIEGYTSTYANPLTDAFAIWAIGAVSKNLRAAYRNGKDMKAREEMLVASFMAGIAMANAYLGNAHVLAHPLGGRFHMSHGAVCAVLLPYVMDFNLPANLEKFANIAAAMGKDISGLSVAKAAKKSIEAVNELISDLGLPKTLSELGVDMKSIPAVVKDCAIQDSNPRKTTAKDLADICEAAMKAK